MSYTRGTSAGCLPRQLESIHKLTVNPRIPPHILWRGSRGFIQCGKIALVEHPHLVRLKRSDGAVQQATIVEQDKVLFFPVMWVDQIRRNGRTLHLVQ